MTSPQDEAAERAALAQLRQILVGPEQTQLNQLQHRLDDDELAAQHVSRVLPEAIVLREQDVELTKALAPMIEESLKVSVRKNPQNLVDAIFPVMGPAIRKSIAENLRALLQSFNRTLEHSLSMRSLKWRLEALRTGKPLAEIILLHTLLYRVEQVFLIHASNGLLLQHVAAKSVEAQDGDMISAMMTAIG